MWFPRRLSFRLTRLLFLPLRFAGATPPVPGQHQEIERNLEVFTNPDRVGGKDPGASLRLPGIAPAPLPSHSPGRRHIAFPGGGSP